LLKRHSAQASFTVAIISGAPAAETGSAPPQQQSALPADYSESETACPIATSGVDGQKQATPPPAAGSECFTTGYFCRAARLASERPQHIMRKNAAGIGASGKSGNIVTK